MPGSATTSDVVRDADALITRTRTACTKELLEGSSVKAIATATIGFDHIDTIWCENNGIAWSNAPGCNSWSVKQYISAALVTLARKHSLNLENMTLGVVGVGNVGSKVAQVGRALGMKVLLNDPPRERISNEGFVSLDTIIDESDIITVHVPLVKDGPDKTYHLFDESLIGRLTPHQILINSSRGQVVDNKALKKALQEKRLKGAVLDVWEGEPAIDLELLDLLDISTPHIAGYSADGKANGTAMSVRYIARQLGIEPLLNWSPEDIPSPSQSLSFSIDAREKTALQVLTEAILYTYDIEADSLKLKSSPADFERLRGDYIIRREPSAFSLELIGADSEIKSKLIETGYEKI